MCFIMGLLQRVSTWAEQPEIMSNLVAKKKKFGFDTDLNLEACFDHLRNMFKMQSILPFGDTKTILQACISSRFDYFNSRFTRVSQKKPLDCLQALQLSGF